MKTCTIDGTKISDMAHLHAVLARELAFPVWYGKNLDALYDCLTDLREETVLTLRYPAALEERLGRKAGGFFRTLEDAAAVNSKLNIIRG